MKTSTSFETSNTAARAIETPTGPRRRVRLLALLAVLLGAFTPALALAGPAHAAGSYSTGIYFCSPYANSSVQLQVWYQGRWQGYSNGRSGANGCATFRYVDAGYYYKVQQPYSFACSSGVNETNFKVSQVNRSVSVGGMYNVSHYRWC